MGGPERRAAHARPGWGRGGRSPPQGTRGRPRSALTPALSLRARGPESSELAVAMLIQWGRGGEAPTEETPRAGGWARAARSACSSGMGAWGAQPPQGRSARRPLFGGLLASTDGRLCARGAAWARAGADRVPADLLLGPPRRSRRTVRRRTQRPHLRCRAAPRHDRGGAALLPPRLGAVRREHAARPARARRARRELASALAARAADRPRHRARGLRRRGHPAGPRGRTARAGAGRRHADRRRAW